MAPNDPYAGREQTLVKHQVLRTYLSRFAPIVLSHWSSITYVDCFSGPWEAQTNDLSDTSFAVALDELRKARRVQEGRGRQVELRCFFLEQSAKSYARLEAFAASTSDATIETRNAALEDSIQQIVDFVRRGGSETFPFIFVDPTGWTGFAMEVIAPLLQLKPGEALINLMTKDIRRFIESPQRPTEESFRRLFGRTGVQERMAGLRGLGRDDAVVDEYGQSVRQTGGFQYVCSAIVLHPQRDRTHFHLIYATRHRRGVEVFKDAEKKAMETQESARATAEERRRLASTGMESLFGQEMHDTAYYDEIRGRYLERSRRMARQILEARGRVSYDELWDAVLTQPLTWESDLKGWLRQWTDEGSLSHEGWTPRQRVPHLEAGNMLVWRGPR